MSMSYISNLKCGICSISNVKIYRLKELYQGYNLHKYDSKNNRCNKCLITTTNMIPCIINEFDFSVYHYLLVPKNEINKFYNLKDNDESGNYPMWLNDDNWSFKIPNNEELKYMKAITRLVF